MGARGEDQGHETVDARGLRTAKGGVRADHYQSRINQGGAQADDQERGLGNQITDEHWRDQENLGKP